MGLDAMILFKTFLCINFIYLATLSNSLMNSSSFLIASFRIFYVWYHVIWKQWQFYFFSSLDSFLFLFLLLLLLLGLLKLYWIKIVWVDILVLFLILEEIFFYFSSLRIRFAVGLSYIDLIMLKYVPYMPSSWRVFNNKWVLSFGKNLFLHLLIWL